MTLNAEKITLAVHRRLCIDWKESSLVLKECKDGGDLYERKCTQVSISPYFAGHSTSSLGP